MVILSIGRGDAPPVLQSELGTESRMLNPQPLQLSGSSLQSLGVTFELSLELGHPCEVRRVAQGGSVVHSMEKLIMQPSQQRAEHHIHHSGMLPEHVEAHGYALG